MTSQEPDPARPTTARSGRVGAEPARFPLWLTSWSTTALAMLAGAAAVVLLALPWRPGEDDGFADLGWFLVVLGGGALVAVLAGTVVLYVTLRNGGAPHPGATASVFVPLAVALGAVSAGVGALLAPGIASWLVGLVSTRRAAAVRPGRRPGSSG